MSSPLTKPKVFVSMLATQNTKLQKLFAVLEKSTRSFLRLFKTDHSLNLISSPGQPFLSNMNFKS